jgi:hypothetical protein
MNNRYRSKSLRPDGNQGSVALDNVHLEINIQIVRHIGLIT